MKTYEQHCEEVMQRYYYLKAHHICVRCGQRQAFHKSVSCEICKEKQEVWNEENRQAINDKQKAVYDKRVAEGLCVRCGKEPATNGLRTCEKCRTKTNKDRLKLYHKNKQQCNKSYIREGLTDAQRANLEKARNASLKSEKSKTHREKVKKQNHLLIVKRGSNG